MTQGQDTIYVHEGTYDENVDAWKRVMLIGDGADMVTVRAANASDYIPGMSGGVDMYRKTAVTFLE